MAEEEHVGSQIGAKASEMAGEIELTARDLARVGQEATALAGALAAKVASVQQPSRGRRRFGNQSAGSGGGQSYTRDHQ